MHKKRYIWVFFGIVILLSALVSGFILMQPTAEELLVQTLETTKSISTAHAVVEISADTVEKDGTATVEIWGLRGADGPGAFRLEVLETSDEDAAGAVAVSDGETLWAYTPSKGKAFVGTLEEAKSIMAERYPEGGEFDKGDYEHPETAEESVQRLLEYFTVEKQGSDEIAGVSTRQLKMMPIPEQMPSEYTAVGGYVNLWIDEGRSLPLAVDYTGGRLCEFNITVVELDIKQNFTNEESLFKIEFNAGVEVIYF